MYEENVDIAKQPTIVLTGIRNDVKEQTIRDVFNKFGPIATISSKIVNNRNPTEG